MSSLMQGWMYHYVMAETTCLCGAEARLAAEEEPIVEAAADAEGHGMKTRAEQDEDQDDLLPQEVIAALSRRSR